MFILINDHVSMCNSVAQGLNSYWPQTRKGRSSSDTNMILVKRNNPLCGLFHFNKCQLHPLENAQCVCVCVRSHVWTCIYSLWCELTNKLIGVLSFCFWDLYKKHKREEGDRETHMIFKSREENQTVNPQLRETWTAPVVDVVLNHVLSLGSVC